MSATKSQGFSQIPHGFHKRLIELKGARLSVWFAHRCMEGAAGESYPSLSRLVEYTGLNIHTVTDVRKWLRDNGWLTSSGQKHTEQGQFSIPIEHTTIPPAVGGKPTNGASGKTAGGKPTNGASGKTASGLTASGKPTTEVDPKDFEVDPAFEVDPKKKKREREVDAAPAATSAAPAAESPKTSLPLLSPAAGSKDAQDVTDLMQEKTQAERDKIARQAINTIIEHAKSRRDGKAGFSKTARAELLTALRDMDGVTLLEIDAAIDDELKNCRDDDPTSYVIFGSRLAANIVPFIRTYRVCQAAAKRKDDEVSRRAAYDASPEVQAAKKANTENEERIKSLIMDVIGFARDRYNQATENVHQFKIGMTYSSSRLIDAIVRMEDMIDGDTAVDLAMLTATIEDEDILKFYDEHSSFAQNVCDTLDVKLNAKSEEQAAVQS